MAVSEAVKEAINNQNVNHTNQDLPGFEENATQNETAQEIISSSSDKEKLTKGQQIKSTGKKKTKTTGTKRKQTDIRGELIFFGY